VTQRAIDSGHPVWANSSGADLAWMLEEAGDRAGARKHYLRVAEAGPNGRAETALESLVILLSKDDDLDGLRALHHTETANSSAPDVLEAIGRLLDERGDAEGARQAFQHGNDLVVNPAPHRRADHQN
jgi:hypothetical protein